MFTERFDSLMNIAEISNSTLARAVYMTPSHISRLRTGARPLPKKHNYLTAICLCLTEHFKKDYQINALRTLTGIGTITLSSKEDIAQYLENWLMDSIDRSDVTSRRLTSGALYCTAKTNSSVSQKKNTTEKSQLYAEYLYGNAGKRKAVEQFFLQILQEEKSQEILLFSDENMAWLYEDNAFVARWMALFTKVILKGNCVKVIHTISRDMNEIIEAVAKWTPIYSTGMIEPYYYPRLRDGIFQNTIFLAPKTAAILSTSVQQDTEGMLNLFITDKTALNAIQKEYENYLSICRPLMRIFTIRNVNDFKQAIGMFAGMDGNIYICSSSLPLFAMPEHLVNQLAKQTKNNNLILLWKKDLAFFQKNIENHQLFFRLLKSELNRNTPFTYHPPLSESLCQGEFSYSKEEYLIHLEHLKKMQKQYKNLNIEFYNDLKSNILLYVKEEIGVVMVKTDIPRSVFIITEQIMIHAFWDYLSKYKL